MKLALLGVDDDALALARWAVQEGGHELVAAYDVAGGAANVLDIAPRAVIGDQWESLLIGAGAQAVIVGRGGAGLTNETGIPDSERRGDQLRKLTQAAIPLVVVCPACEAIVGFEIEMIRRDTRAVIVPYIPGAQHPAIARLEEIAAWDESSPIGRVEQIIFEREQADRSREAVLCQLARDIGLLRRLVGTIRSVSASGVAAALGRDPLGPKPKELPPLANLSVHLVSEEDLPVRWSIGPGQEPSLGRVTLSGTRGKAILQISPAAQWQLEIVAAQISRESFPSQPSPERIFWQLSHAASAEEFYDESVWLNACRDQEAAEAADRSLQRGRTIELFSEEHTEESSFKGVMAMGGCLVLVVALAAVLLATLVDGLQQPLRNWALFRLWPFYLLAPVALFLLLQLLQLAIKRESSGSGALAGSQQAGK